MDGGGDDALFSPFFLLFYYPQALEALVASAG
jgi:hypothetical protein